MRKQPTPSIVEVKAGRPKHTTRKKFKLKKFYSHHRNVVHPAQNQCGTQRQEVQVQLQKVKQAHDRRANLLEQIVKHWQDRDANSNKAD